MVALSMADGWARVTGRPQAVIVHVDVGTQALSCAMHNASIGRVPVLVFAGLCPFTEDGQRPGSRTEYQHWLQDAVDQKGIVRQYCRYVGDFRTGTTVKETVQRALQFATSNPKGPVYLTGAREVMAEVIGQQPALDQEQYGPIDPAALPESAVATIAAALVNAKTPVVITGYSGRNHDCPPQLVQLANRIPGLRIFETGGSDLCFPMTHPAACGFRLAFDPATSTADVILIVDCDVPWIPSRNPPQKGARIYHIDVDPLNATIDLSFFPAHGRWKADSFTALSQLNSHLSADATLLQKLKDPIYAQRGEALAEEYSKRIESYNHLGRTSATDSPLNIHQLGAAIKAAVPHETICVMEAVTLAMHLSDQIRAEVPGSWLNCGGAGLGWGGGAALGVKLAANANGRPKFVCQIAGDGAFLFAAPSSVHWIAARYGIPILTIVLNNRGMLVHFHFSRTRRLPHILSNPSHV